MASATALKTGPIKALHEESPLRVWSLIVTIFGDIVMNQGLKLSPDPIWNGALLELMEKMGIEPGLVRTSLSRLVANQTLLRLKSGRNTYYELEQANRRAFGEAAELIYGRKRAEANTGFELVVIDRCTTRNEARDALTTQGFRFLGPTTAVKPANTQTQSATLPAEAIRAFAESSQALSKAAMELWKINALNQGYQNFLATFPILKVDTMSDDEAVTTRILLVHQFRRLVLRDPGLPESSLPKDWNGAKARDRFTQNLAMLEKPSTRWIRQNAFLSGRTLDK